MSFATSNAASGYEVSIWAHRHSPGRRQWTGRWLWGGGRALEKGVSKGHEEVVSLSGKCFTEAALRPDMVALFWGNNPSM